MMTLAFSGLTVVSICAGSASSDRPAVVERLAQLRSKRPLALERAPRPRTMGIWEVKPWTLRKLAVRRTKQEHTVDAAANHGLSTHAHGDHRRPRPRPTPAVILAQLTAGAVDGWCARC
jgi:hypothetical protein